MRKFKCIGYNQNYEKNFTVGKIYYGEDDSGIKCDDGFVYDSYRSIDEVIDFLSGYYEFEEVFDEEIKEDKKVGKLKVGDIIVGNNTNRNIFTSKGTKCKVIEIINEKEIKVNIIDSSYPDKSLEFKVKSKDFDLVESSNSKTITITTSDTITTLTDGTHTTSINRYYTDKHDDMIALEEVVKKYKSEMEEMERAEKMPKVGDKVRVIDDGRCYCTYSGWFIENNIDVEYALKWVEGKCLNYGEEFVVVAVHPHRICKKENIALVTGIKGTFMIDVEGLEVIK